MNVLAEGFLQSLRERPDAPALNIEGVSYSYWELSRYAAAIQEEIRKFPAQKRIGVVCNNNVQTYAALLAVLCSGSAYVPLNPNYPKERLVGMISSSGIDLVIGGSDDSFEGVKLLLPAIPTLSKSHLELYEVQGEAYVLFTSGSTGEPKGVPVSQRNIKSFFDQIDKLYPLLPDDKVLQAFDLSFDVSVFSIFSAWKAGACLYVPSSVGFKALNIIAMLRDNNITVAGMVPTVLRLNEKYLEGIDLPHLRLTFFAGERLPLNFVKKWKRNAPNSRIVNCYGPTEATIFATTCEYSEELEQPSQTDMAIGKILPGLEKLIVDDDGKNSNEGELLLTGDLVIKGYVNGAHESSFVSVKGKRYYRTGDQVREDDNGDLHFLGRNDQQVKISGYRVELQEIEAGLLTCGFVQAAAVVVGAENTKVIVAFVKGKVPKALELLSLKLPAFMIPAEIIEVPDIPISPNGKVDRQQLIDLYERKKDIV